MWVESHASLKDHPKTRKAARMLGISIPAMIGHLHLLWYWCLTWAEDGDLSGFEHADIAEAMMWEGDPDSLIDALVNCGRSGGPGFLRYDDDGRLLVNDWMEYAGKLIERRRESREAAARGNHERWHVQRGKFDPACPYCVSSFEPRPELGSESDANRGAIGGRFGGRFGSDSGAESDTNRVLSHLNHIPDKDYDLAATAFAGDPPTSVAELVLTYAKAFPEQKKYGVGGRVKANQTFTSFLNENPEYQVHDLWRAMRRLHERGIRDPSPWDVVQNAREHPTIRQIERQTAYLDRIVG